MLSYLFLSTKKKVSQKELKQVYFLYLGFLCFLSFSAKRKGVFFAYFLFSRHRGPRKARKRALGSGGKTNLYSLIILGFLFGFFAYFLFSRPQGSSKTRKLFLVSFSVFFAYFLFSRKESMFIFQEKLLELKYLQGKLH